MRTFILVLVLSGCVTTSAVPAAMHPTAAATEKSVGVAIGGAYLTQQDTKVLTIPYAEGSIRSPMSVGQLGLHVAPNVAYATYRYDLMKLEDGVGFAIEPLVGGSYFKYSNTPPMGTQTKSQELSIMAGIAPTVLFKAGSSFAYAIPKFGFQFVKDLEATMGQKDTSKLWVLGLSLGIDIGNGVSFELAVHRIDDADTETRDTPAAWLFVPSIGVRH